MKRRAALVVLARRFARVDPAEPDALELYLVERSPRLKFFGGHFAFPGGVVDAGDADAPLSRAAATATDERTRRACAVRELFEETGILVAEPEAPGGSMPDATSIAAVRRALVDGAEGHVFVKFLSDSGLVIPAAALRPLARLVTPRFSPRRYDSVFYLMECDAEPEVIEGELIGGRWVRPSAALADWRGGRLRLAGPVVPFIEAFARLPMDEAARELGELPSEFRGSGRAIPYAPGYDLMPLETPPLPPTIPTNTLFVGGEEFIIVDPGPRGEAETKHLLEALDRRLAAGRLRAVVLTHHHPDHVGAVDAVVAHAPAPVWGHPLTARRLGRELERHLDDGDLVELGRSPDGRAGWTLRVLFTPGHAEGHIALYDERHRSLVGGDLVSTLVSMYVGSPGGNLRQYFDSLERVRACDADVLYPAHGPPSHQVRRLLDDTLRHRRERLEETYAHLDETPASPAEIAARVYPQATERMRELTERATRAALEYLVETGRARESAPDQFVRAK